MVKAVLSYIDIFYTLFLFCIPFILWSRKKKSILLMQCIKD
jgi:hypothetical protein